MQNLFGKTSGKKLKTNPENEAIVSALKAALRELPIEQVLPYAQVNNLIKGKRYLLDKARREIEQECGFVLSTVYGQGIKRISKPQCIGVECRAKIMRSTKKAADRMVSAIKKDRESMSREDFMTTQAEINRIGAIRLFTEVN